MAPLCVPAARDQAQDPGKFPEQHRTSDLLIHGMTTNGATPALAKLAALLSAYRMSTHLAPEVVLAVLRGREYGQLTVQKGKQRLSQVTVCAQAHQRRK